MTTSLSSRATNKSMKFFQSVSRTLQMTSRCSLILPVFRYSFLEPSEEKHIALSWRLLYSKRPDLHNHIWKHEYQEQTRFSYSTMQPDCVTCSQRRQKRMENACPRFSLVTSMTWTARPTTLHLDCSPKYPSMQYKWAHENGQMVARQRALLCFLDRHTCYNAGLETILNLYNLPGPILCNKAVDNYTTWCAQGGREMVKTYIASGTDTCGGPTLFYF